MKVRPKQRRPIREIPGERFRFYAPSDTFGQPDHLVDLEENKGLGQCDCKWWVCKCGPAMLEGSTDFMLITCKHVRRCLVRFARREIQLHLEHQAIEHKAFNEPRPQKKVYVLWPK